MKLFGDFEALKFSQKNLIFVTQNGYLYYIYNPEFRHWETSYLRIRGFCLKSERMYVCVDH